MVGDGEYIGGLGGGVGDAAGGPDVQYNQQDDRVEIRGTNRVPGRRFVEHIRRHRLRYLAGAIAVLGIVGLIVWVIKENSLENPVKSFSDFYRERIDPSVPPCVDFYKFACGKTTAKYQADKRRNFDTLAELNEKALMSLERLLQKPPSESDSQQLTELKHFYKVCSNGATIEAQGIAPLQKLVQDLGDWPLLSGRKLVNERWDGVVQKMNRAGFGVAFPFQLDTSPIPRNSSEISLRLMPFFFGERPLLSDYNRTHKYIKVLWKSLSGSNEHIDQDIQDCWKFESNLHKIAPYDFTDRKSYTVANLTEVFSGISWNSLFENIFIGTDVIIKPDTVVNLANPSNTLEIIKLLEDTPVETIKNYLIFRVLNEAVAVMTDELRAHRHIFLQEQYTKTRSFDCVQLMNEKASIHVGKLYIENVFNSSVKSEAEAIFTDIREHAHEHLATLTWMSHKNIVENLKSLQFIAGFDYDDGNKLLLEKLVFTKNRTGFDCYRELMRFDRNFGYGTAQKTLQIRPQNIVPYFALKNLYQAFTFAPTNTLYTMPVLFQIPIFHMEQPKYAAYGGLGFVISHEMTHGLRILDVCKDPKSCTSYKNFESSKNCMINLYGNYTIERVNKTIDGIRTLSENIGDVLGLKYSYYAYDDWMKTNNWTEKEELIAGFGYTPRQAFWIQAALTFCGHMDEEELLFYMDNEIHSVPEARINVGFANVREFSRDFNCSIGSVMAPLTRCDFD